MSPAEAAAVAREVNCDHCWQRPGLPCNPRGEHLARYQRAERKGLLSREDLATVVVGLEVIAGHVYVPVPVADGRAA